MFNLSGSEIVVILLLALVVLGPDKLPDAIRRFGRIYGELRKMGTGFQSEFRNAFEEPLKELRETAQLTRDAVMNPLDEATKPAEAAEPNNSAEPNEPQKPNEPSKPPESGTDEGPGTP